MSEPRCQVITDGDMCEEPAPWAMLFHDHYSGTDMFAWRCNSHKRGRCVRADEIRPTGFWTYEGPPAVPVTLEDE